MRHRAAGQPTNQGARRSIILTSNRTYGKWGDIFSDQVLAVPILDCLLDHSVTISIRWAPAASRTDGSRGLSNRGDENGY